MSDSGVKYRRSEDIATELLIAFFGAGKVPVFSSEPSRGGKECAEWVGDAYTKLLEKVRATERD